MGAVGDLDSYLRYKSALALGEAATSSGGAGGAMNAAAGLGLGLSVMRSAQEGTALPAETSAVLTCASCSLTAPAGSRFCPHCGTSLVANLCTNCHQPLIVDTRYCANCGTASDLVGDKDEPDGT